MSDKEKFPEHLRSFETRLQFLEALFSDLFKQCDIMAHCVAHKLDRSYLAYLDELKYSMLNLSGEDPLEVLKRIN